jgi:5'-nucleotidase
VLTIREADGALTPGEALRELLHDATEFMRAWDCITPLKAQLGEPFHALDARLQSAIDTRYRLPEWTPEAYAIHKRADGVAAASEAFHVVRNVFLWSHKYDTPCDSCASPARIQARRTTNM